MKTLRKEGETFGAIAEMAERLFSLVDARKTTITCMAPDLPTAKAIAEDFHLPLAAHSRVLSEKTRAKRQRPSSKIA